MIPTEIDTTIHLARCIGCDYSVRYRPLTSGAGFALIDSDVALGIGANGRPMCPNWHGEMELADDRLSAAEAIEQVADQLQSAVQGDLPGIVPAFNWQGAYLELESMSLEVDRLHRIWENDARTAKESKAQWEEASKRRDRAAIEYRRRRLAKGDDATPQDAETNLVRCTWEQAHPDEECPLCQSPEDAAYAIRRGIADTARDGALHIEAVDRWLYMQSTDVIVGLVEAAGIRLPLDVVNAWSVEDRAAVKAWAEIENGLADKPEHHERPAILGTAHVAQEAILSESSDRDGDTYQCCVECGARLLSVKTGSGETFEPYPAGTLVGVDCKGAGPARYPKRGRGKKASA